MTTTRKHPQLPTLKGVSASSVALPAGPWPTVFEFLCDRFPAIKPQEWLARFEEGLVLDANGAVLSHTQPYTPHTVLHYYRRVPNEPELPFQAQVLFQDAHLVVADKPHFMPVTPAGRYVRSSLLVQLKEQLGIDTLSPLHRIDRETAGLVVFSVVTHERDAYQALFRERQ
ncbi:MAG: pseudouridine synthase, partial [Limnohabitans sp.]|nr:pseudouridine synthase [Limnohabitans sp.]